jgi:hypothetical protein
MHFETTGQIHFGIFGQPAPPELLVLDHGRARPIEPWERAGVAAARRELSRMAENRRRRVRRRAEGAPEIVFPDCTELETRRERAAAQGVATCTLRT